MGFEEPLSRLRCLLAHWYMQWELLTTLYVMEPAEKCIINSIVVFTVGVVLYAAFTHIPPYLVTFCNFVFDSGDKHI